MSDNSCWMMTASSSWMVGCSTLQHLAVSRPHVLLLNGPSNSEPLELHPPALHSGTCDAV